MSGINKVVKLYQKFVVLPAVRYFIKKSQSLQLKSFVNINDLLLQLLD